MSPSGPADDSAWLRAPMTDSGEIAERYDQWAETYDADLVEQWRYDAPTVAARRLVACGVTGRVLDVGCGTGLVGRALADAGLTDITGVDLSQKSLDRASARGVYQSLAIHDFNRDLLPFEDRSFDGAICVGVLSYAHDAVAVVRDIARVTRPTGTIVFTHRIDLWDATGFGDALRSLESAGTLSDVSWSEPQEYMPGSPDVADLRIRYVTVTVGG